MAIQSLADFYESWFPTTSLRQTLEQKLNVKRAKEVYKRETKTPESRQAYIDEIISGYKTRALSGDPEQIRGFPGIYGYATNRIQLPTYRQFYDQLAEAYGGYLDTAATQLEQELMGQEAQFEQVVGQFAAESEAAKAETARAQRAALVAKRFTSLAEQRQSQQAPSASVQTGTSRNVRQQKQIGQPGVQVTKVSKAAVGGYGGTAPGRINPTGLNI